MELRIYQKEISDQAASKLKEYGCCYLSMECRTGKSLTALATAHKYGAKKVLFISKLKALPSIQADYELLKPNFELTTINFESCHKIVGSFELIVIDEAHSLGAFPKPSKRTEAIKGLCGELPVLFLSGTPSPESYSQLFHQFWVCTHSPWKKYKNFYRWAKDYVNVCPKKVNGYTLNDYSDANKAKIDSDTKHLFISYSQEQAGFDTTIKEETLEVKMLPSTKLLFSTLKKNRVVEVRSNTILADSPAKLLSKLHQISSGTVISEDGTHILLDGSKAMFIRDKFKDKKLAIFYVFQSEFDLLKQVFPNWTDSPEVFQASTDKTFISQVRRAREGVRLDSADALIFYNLEFSYLSYEQGRNRLISKERQGDVCVYFVCSDFGLEKDVLEAVHGKQDFTLSWYQKYSKVDGK